MRKNAKKYPVFHRALALILALALTWSILPTDARAADGSSVGSIPGTVETVSDPETLTRPAAIYGDNTRNSGKVTVGKSVSDEATAISYGGKSQTFTPEEDNFIVTISQSAQVMGMSSQSKLPVDVVFVLDTSGSMKDDGRAEDMVDAANEAIKTLMESNEHNRVAVVAFSSAGYGGGSSGGNAANVLSSLAHYNDTDNNNDGDLNDWGDVDAASGHLDWNGNQIQGRDMIRSQQGWTYRASRNGKYGGTNIHAGIALGAQQLVNASTTVEIDGRTVTRMPFIVLLSDGAPTFSADGDKWYEPSQTSQQGDGERYFSGNGILPALTAAYYKGLITDHYYGAAASELYRCSIYTIGVDVGGNELAQMTLDPREEFSATSGNDYYNSFRNAWNSYQNKREFSVTVNSGTTYTVKEREATRWDAAIKTITATTNYVNGLRTDENGNAVSMGYTGGIVYNDGYYETGDEENGTIADAFQRALGEIQEKAISAPTRVDSVTGADFSGYVTFTDPLGEYMEVKAMKGILADGNWYRGATFARHMEGYGNSSDSNYNADFEAKLIEVLETRMKLSSSPDLDVDAFLTQASQSRNQAYYNSADDYDNSICWWGNAFTAGGEEDQQVQLLGFADDDSIDYITDENTAIPAGADYVCRSYFFYGTAGDTLETPNHEYLYFVVRVQRSLTAPYQQTVVISAPASLLSMERVFITESEDENGQAVYTAKVEESEPARVVYEVGLRSDINAENVAAVLAADAAENNGTYLSEKPVSEADGSVVGLPNVDGADYYFYTNDWDRTKTAASHERALTKATFDAAADNSFYTYQEDTLILNSPDRNDVCDDASHPTGLKYYAREYYDWSQATFNAEKGVYEGVEKKVAFVEVRLPDVSDPAIIQKDGQWYIAKGAYTASTLMVTGDDVTKGENITETSGIVAHPARTGSSNNSHYTVWLGNNGRLKLTAKDAKTVDVTKADNTVIENADGQVVMVGDTLTYHVEATNSTGETADITITDTVPQGSEYVADSADQGGVYDETTQTITWEIKDVADGETVTVSFSVVVTEAALSGELGVPSIDNTATVQIGDHPAYETNTTKNPPEGKKVVDTDGNPLPEEGVTVPEVLVYRIRYYNDGEEAADVAITDIIPAGTTYVPESASHNGVYDADSKTVSWLVPNVAPGTSGVVSFRVDVDATVLPKDPVTNHATIQIGEGEVRVTNETETKVKSGDLALSKTVVDAPANADKEFTLVLTEISGKMNQTFTLSGSSKAQTVTFENGVARVVILADETIVVEDLPAGVILAVSEESASGFTATLNPADGRVTIVADDEETAQVESVTVAVTNTYSATPARITFEGTKTLTGRELSAQDFSFVVKLNGQIKYSVNTDADGKLLFPEITYTEPGTYTYTISETNNSLHGVSYDESVYTVVVEVTDNGKGALEAAITSFTRTVDGQTEAVADEKADFTNTFTPDDVSITLEAKKELWGRELQNNEFGFEVKDSQGNTVATGYAGADGNVVFTPITYTLEDLKLADGSYDSEKDFSYTITEVNGGLKGVEYSTSSFTVKVRVTYDETTGTLSAQVVKDSTAIGGPDVPTFVNRFTPDDVTVQMVGNKTLTGRTLKDKEFTFVVKEGSQVVASGTNDANGGILFTPIAYGVEDVGTHTYEITELVPDVAFDPNLYYDETSYTVTVTVTYDETTGKLTATERYADGSVEFVNVQHPDSVEVTPEADKTTTGSVPDEAAFSFSVINTQTGAEAGAGVGAANGSVTFSELSFSEPGTYTYWIRETRAGQQLNGISYDADCYLMKVLVTRTDGLLEADVSYFALKEGGNADDTADYTVPVSALSFENEYDASGYINLTATKVLEGRDLKAGEFAFKLTRQDNGTSVDGVVAANGTITFATLYFSGDEFGEGVDTKVIHYVMSEVIPTTAALPGVTYDRSEHDVYVLITDNNDGTISAQLCDEDGNPANSVKDTGVTFTNTYAPMKGTSATITATKTLTGRHMEEGEFTFQLWHNGQIVASASNADGGNVTFKREYPASTQPGTYTYQVRELNNKLGGISYDDSVFDVTVTITDNGDGTLSASVAYPDGAVTFENSYDAADTTFTPEGTKTLTGRALGHNDFSFEVVDKAAGKVVSVGHSEQGVKTASGSKGDISFTPISITEAGTYTYVITEVSGGGSGITYDDSSYEITVTVTDDGDGNLVPQVTAITKDGKAAEAVSFTNSYRAAGTTYTPEADKVLTGRALSENEFGFVVEQKNASGGYDVVANGHSAAPAGADKSAADILFNAIGYDHEDLNGQTSASFVYRIREIDRGLGGVEYDSTVYYLKVTVTDDQTEGKLVAAGKYYADEACTQPVNAAIFRNVYTAQPAKLDLTANKTLVNKTLAAGEFSFLLAGPEGYAPQSKTNDASGAVKFDTLTFTAPGTYVFTVSELSPANEGVRADGTYTYDTEPVTVTVTVTDDGKGQLHASAAYEKAGAAAGSIEFINRYAPGPLSEDLTLKIGAVKAVTTPDGQAPAGYRLAENAFRFSVTDISGNEVTQGYNLADTDGDGKADIVFEKEFTFTSAGAYRFWITEIVPDPAPEGIIMDTASWELHVLVRYNSQTGALYIEESDVKAYSPSAQQELAAEDAGSDPAPKVTFVNLYDPKPAQVSFQMKKELTGRELKAGEFVFHLMETVAGTEQIRAEARNADDGTVKFDLSYTLADLKQADGSYADAKTFTYTVHEHEPAAKLPGVTYSEQTYTVTVTLTDEGAGQLKAEVSGSTDGLFTNTYKAAPTTIQLNASKMLEGRSLKEGEFTFQVTDEEGNVAARQVNAADGTVVFPAIEYTEAGTYTYTVTEVKGDLVGVTYDETVYTAVVTVVDDLAGQLRASVEYATENGAIPVFTNGFDPQAIGITLEGTKTLTGRKLKEGEFSFLVTDEAGQQAATGTNKANGDILFDSISIDEAGTYTYTVTEVKGDLENVTYDESVYTVTVTVTNEDGILVPEVVYAEGSISFHNEYDQPDPPKTPDKPKEEKPSDPNVPDTGDHSNPALYIIIMIVCAVGLVLVVLSSRKDKKQGGRERK